MPEIVDAITREIQAWHGLDAAEQTEAIPTLAVRLAEIGAGSRPLRRTAAHDDGGEKLVL